MSARGKNFWFSDKDRWHKYNFRRQIVDKFWFLWKFSFNWCYSPSFSNSPWQAGGACFWLLPFSLTQKSKCYNYCFIHRQPSRCSYLDPETHSNTCIKHYFSLRYIRLEFKFSKIVWVKVVIVKVLWNFLKGLQIYLKKTFSGIHILQKMK